MDGNIRPLGMGGVAGGWLLTTEEGGTVDNVVLGPGTEMLPSSCKSVDSF